MEDEIFHSVMQSSIEEVHTTLQEERGKKEKENNYLNLSKLDILQREGRCGREKNTTKDYYQLALA